MPSTREFFETYLPEKLTKNPALATQVKSVFQFNITGEGTWTLDLREPPGSVAEAEAESPNCTLTVAKDDWEKILTNPGAAMQLFFMGKIKVAGQQALAMQLQNILK